MIERILSPHKKNKLNDEQMTWAVGGSLLLHFHKLIDHPNDIDIIVSENDAAHLNKILKTLGNQETAAHKAPFQTTYFSKYTIKGTSIDIMGGFAIQHEAGIYRFLFSNESITNKMKLNNEDPAMLFGRLVCVISANPE
ncbi:nucleotidyltransferase domain-containing protein [Evansella halocellulosilytica]|uniref:nucleotidyltransferase domain-containing protein n=1 Tax=Evansella halocellulosilytica TaxID=2011013 RepID=UPI000BB76091|nr:hypothetical protein [Evansella halocellulosilytica]